jgi:hypothetical protein
MLWRTTNSSTSTLYASTLVNVWSCLDRWAGGNSLRGTNCAASLVQPFGLVFEDGPDEALYVKEDFPQYGLQAGDKVLQINNRSDLTCADAEALLEPTMNVWIECRRFDLSANAICEALPLEDIDDELARQHVCMEAAVCCDVGNMQETKKPLSNSSTFGGIFALWCSAQDVAKEESAQTVNIEASAGDFSRKLSF